MVVFRSVVQVTQIFGLRNGRKTNKVTWPAVIRGNGHTPIRYDTMIQVYHVSSDQNKSFEHCSYV